MGIINPFRTTRKSAISVALCVGVALALALAGCSSTSGSNTTGGTSSGANATATATSGSANSATSTPGNSNPQNCQQIQGFSGSTPVSNDGRLAAVPFPSTAGYMTQAVDNAQTGLYEILKFNVCMPSTTTSAVYSYYANNSSSQGWTQSSTYPYDGGYQAACGDPYCWSHADGPVWDYLSLENVQAAGGGFVTYRLRLAFPPTLPDCSNILPPGNSIAYNFFWTDASPNVPVPPLTVFGLGDGHGVGNKTVYTQFMCSPGTASSISSYMSKELGQHGWSATSQSECGTTGWMINSAGLAISWQVSNPTQWQLNSCQ